MATETPQPHPTGDGEQRKQRREPRRRRAARWIRGHRTASLIILLLLIALLVFVVLLALYVHSYESTDDAQVDGHISSIGSRLAGTVAEVHVDANQPVKAGQLLVELDPRDPEVAVARAEAELLQAQAQLEATSPQVPITTLSTRTTAQTATEDVANAQAALAAAERDRDAAAARRKQAQAENARAQAERQRAEQLLAQRAMSKQQYDVRIAQARSAAAAVEAAIAEEHAARQAVDQQKARLAQAESREREASTNAPRQVNVQRAMVLAREAAVRAAKAALQRAQLDLSYTRVVAPYDALVGRRAVEVGDAVQQGQTLVTLVDTADLYVTANFKETQLERIRPGQRATVHVDAYDRDFGGWVESIGSATGARFSLLPPENATGNYVKVVQRVPVRIRLDRNPDVAALLRPGMSVEPKVWIH